VISVRSEKHLVHGSLSAPPMPVTSTRWPGLTWPFVTVALLITNQQSNTIMS